jgi:hypothetical protein
MDAPASGGSRTRGDGWQSLTGGGWTRGTTRSGGRRRALGLLAASLSAGVLAACSGPLTGTAAKLSPTPRGTPRPTPSFDAHYNGRAGSNRAAAEVSFAIARDLFKDGVSYWEVFVRTTPLDPDPPSDPLDAAQLARQGAAVTRVDMVMATEAGQAVQKFRAGGHAHEQGVMEGELALLRQAFPKASTIQMRIYYGESHQHALATWSGGALQYPVLDRL